MELPLTRTPSRAIFSPGRTRTRLPTATSRMSVSVHAPSCPSTVAVSGASASRPLMALRARSRALASIASERLKRTMTIAASGYCPMMTAPVTATDMSALMFRLKLETASQPFL